MILVTGATGTVGSELVALLAQAGDPCRALVHSRDRAEPLKWLGVDLVEGDFEKPVSLDGALAGVEKLYLVSPLRPDLGDLERDLIARAQQAGVKRVVKQSVVGAESEAIAVSRWHRKAERFIERSGLEWTHLRPVFFMSNLLGFAQSVKQDGTFAAPTGEGRLALIHPRDIAAVARVVLTQSGHEGKSYVLAGPRLLQLSQVASLLSHHLGREVRFLDVPPEKYRASMSAHHVPEWAIEAMLEMYRMVKAGFGGPLTHTVEQLTGKPPLSLEDWLRENLSYFR